MSRKYSIFITVLFCLFLFGFGIAFLILPDRSFSEQENRYLTQFKAPTVESVFGKNGQFMADFEKYVNDQFPLRDGWIGLKAWSERLIGKQENNGVYFAKDQTLISRVDDPDMDKLTTDMGCVDALAGSAGVPVYFGLIPTAAAVWADKLPAHAPTADELSIIDQLYFSTGAATIDMASPLLAHKDEDIYYRADHHWTSLGAYYGANAILEAMGMEPLNLDDYQKTTVTEDFYGTLYSSSGVRWLPPDSIDTYIPGDGITVGYYDNGKWTEGPLYVDSFLQVKDKYSYFLGGVQGLRVIQTQKTDGPKVLIIRDSYTDSLAPFLTERFSEIHLFDLRYNATSVRDYIAQNDIDSVVVLYSFSNFATDKNLFLLGR